jgi:hypothetical protein
MDDDQKENVSLFAYGGTNVKHTFNLFMQPGTRIKAVQGTFLQNSEFLFIHPTKFIRVRTTDWMWNWSNKI